MTPSGSRVLIVGERPPAGLNSNVQFYSRLQEATAHANLLVDVLAIPILVALSDETLKHIHMIHARNPALQIILVAPNATSVEDLEECINKYPIFQIIYSMQIHDLEPALLSAIEKAQQLKQNQQLETLVREQNEKLRQLYKELEERVEKRQAFLIEARSKTSLANSRWEAVLKATQIIQQAESLGEIENLLTEILSHEMGLSLTRIYFKPQDEMFREQQKSQKIFSTYQANLMRGEDENPLGSIFFLRPKDKNFRKDETDFLQKISEVVSLAIDRLDKLKQTVSFKEHWEATFNAVADPVIIINQNYEVLQSNLAFQKKSALSPQTLPIKTNFEKNKVCYEILFGRNKPCETCHLGNKFRIELKQNSTFEVFSQPLPSALEEQKLFVNQYHEITNQLRMERKIIETARLAEIGTIGSSIAHELNNPLGGMLSFAQLIKMDLPADHPLYQDILELENGVKRCRDIVQNLLGFTRNPGNEENRKLDIKEVLVRALKIVELQSRSMGVEIKFNPAPQPFLVQGYFGHLSQAFQNILQNSLQNIFEVNQTSKNHIGVIEIQLSETQENIVVKILDNSPVSENLSGLGLSLAQQILHDHGGSLTVQQDSKPFRMAKITLPRPVLPA